MLSIHARHLMSLSHSETLHHVLMSACQGDGKGHACDGGRRQLAATGGRGVWTRVETAESGE